MSNTLGTLSGALILQKALDLVFTQRPLLQEISLGFKELDGRVENALLGQSVKSRTRQVATVNAFGTGPSNRSDADVSVTLSSIKEVHHSFTLAEVNSTDRDLVAESAEPIAVAMANHIIDSVAGLWIAANFPTITVASGWSYANTIRALRKALTKAGVPKANRFAVLNSDVYDSLLGDSLIIAALNNPSNGDAIRTGKLPAVSGLALDEYPDMPTTGNMVGFAGTPDSTVYVGRAPKDPREVAPNLPFPGVFDYVEDAKTGFRVAVQQWIDPSTLAVNNRIVWLQGYAVGNTNNGLIVKTA